MSEANHTPFVNTPHCARVVKDNRVVAHLSLGGRTIVMPIGKSKTVLFEMHNYFGPIPLNKRTDEPMDRIPKAFWDAFERWDLGGKMMDGDTCVTPSWCEECGGHGDKTRHLGGRHYEIIGKCDKCKGARIK